MPRQGLRSLSNRRHQIVPATGCFFVLLPFAIHPSPTTHRVIPPKNRLPPLDRKLNDASGKDKVAFAVHVPEKLHDKPAAMAQAKNAAREKTR